MKRPSASIDLAALTSVHWSEATSRRVVGGLKLVYTNGEARGLGFERPGEWKLMLMTGDLLDAGRALSWGLVSEVLEFSELRPRALALAQTIAARAPIAAETAKTNLRAAYAVPLETAVQYERDLQTICFATEDAKEGRDAFKQKRTAHFNRR